VQVISEQGHDNSYSPAVEWANVKYQLTPDISIRAGRIVLPAFLVSDYRKVGYANPWVRPPVEVYGLIPLSSSDGVDASYRARVGEFTNTVNVTYGQSQAKFPAGSGGSTAKAKDAWSISSTAEYGAATAHITYHKTKLTLESESFEQLFGGFRQFGPEGVALADKYDPNNGKPFTFIGVGAMYDPGSWFVMGEWGSTESRSVLGKRSAWYVSGGYRAGKLTPYLTYAETKADSNTSDPGLTLSGLPPFLAGPAAGLNAGLNAALGSKPAQKTVSIGARWDFAKNADFKLQLDHTRLGAGSAGTLINVQPGFQPGGKVNVLSVSIDFVF
jgi:predicted porin